MKKSIKNKERSETMYIAIKELSEKDGIKEMELLKMFSEFENGFGRNATDDDLKDLDAFKLWLKKRVNHSKGIGLKEGWVPDTTYWILLENKPVGMIKVRHFLNEQLLHSGGNIGYGIAPIYRGKGIMKEALKLLLPIINEKYNIKKALISVEKENIASQKCAVAVGGVLSYEEDNKYFYWIEIEKE